MAKVVYLSNNPNPANAGEERVLAFLEKSLPDSISLIPNLTIPYAFPNTPEEYDIIAVTPDAVFVIEVKDLAPSVEISEQEMLVGGDIRRNPYLATRLKAQKLKTRLSDQLNWFGSAGWVEPVVILARKPQSLKICESMQGRIVLLENSPHLFLPPSPSIRPNFHGNLLDRHAHVVSAITGGAIERVSPILFGMYEATSKLIERNNMTAWRAKHRLSGVEMTLEVFKRPENLAPPHVDEWKKGCTAMMTAAEEIGTSAYIDMPREILELDDGSVVVVWPLREPNILDFFVSQIRDNEVEFDSERARRVASGFAGAIAHLHASGRIVGEISRHNVFVRPNGFGAITLGTPIPVLGTDTSKDLHWLGEVIALVSQTVDDQILNELHTALRDPDSTKRPSANFVQAVLMGETLSTRVSSTHLLDRFDTVVEVASHQYGRTVKAYDKDSKQEVLLKYESGRPETSWSIREYRALTSSVAIMNNQVVTPLAGGSDESESFVAIEWLNAPKLSSLIDAGVLRDPERARSVTLQILQVLKELHPDVQKIQQILARSGEVLTEEEQLEIGELRNSGIAHNHLTPTNIFIDENRGVVLADFVRAARFGEEIPDRVSDFWPTSEVRTISNPLADLFAVGALLLRMLVTTQSGINVSEASNSELHSHLVSVALRAISDDPQARFKSASEFIDVLVAGASDLNVNIEAQDVLAIQREIEDLLTEGRFDEAERICPSDWTLTLDRIREKRRLTMAGGEVLLEIQGVSLTYVGTRELPPGSTTSKGKHDGGTAELYLVKDGQGGVIELLDCSAVAEQGLARWTMPGQAMGHPPRIDHAIRSLRMTVDEQGNQRVMELTQAQLKTDAKFENQTTKKKVTEEQLSQPLGKVSAAELLQRFGCTGVGTKEELWGDTGRRKTYLALRFDDDARHVPAVAHFISRFIPLYMGVSEK